MNPKNETIVAIDVAKKSLQAQSPCESFQVANSEEGLAKLRKRLEALSPSRIVCEATGGYERALVRMAIAAAIPVCIVNPARVRAFARSDGTHAKTDDIDAKLLLRFAQQKDLRPILISDAAHSELKALLERRCHLSATLTREKNRLEKEPLFIRDLIVEAIAFVKRQIEVVDQRMEALVNNSTLLKESCKRLETIKGVGTLTACTVLAYLPEIAEVGRNQAVSLAGLAPYNRDSGERTGKRHIFGGRAKIRRCLYMAAQSAAQHNPVIRDYVAGLVNRGKPYKCSLVAAMRKILICMQSLLKNPDFSLA